jgi:hypothetical protein
MKPANYFFVVGCPRSGTTLLSVILDRHSQLCLPPETAFFDEVAPQLSPNADHALREILQGWRRLSELKLKPEVVLQRLGSQRRAPGEVLATILDLYAEAQSKARCGEKTPQHLFHTPCILQLFPAAKIVCLLRDGREVALSLNAMPWWSPRNLEDAANFWKKSVAAAEVFTRQYPDRFKVVRYEDLITHPQALLPSIMEYVGETFEPSQLQADLPSQLIMSRSLEWKEQALQPIDPHQPGQRLNRATAEEIAFLEQTLGEELRHHGYRLP